MSTKLERPKVNVPRQGVLREVRFAPSKKAEYDDEILVGGHWRDLVAGQVQELGEGHFYLSYSALQAFCAAGLLLHTGQDAKGPTFQVLDPNLWIEILRVEEGKAKPTRVRRLDGAVTPLPNATLTAPPAPARAGAAPPPPPPAGAPVPPVPLPPAGVAGAPVVGAPSTPTSTWKDVELAFSIAQAIAAFRLSELLGRALGPDDAAAIQAGAGTVLRHAEAQGVQPVPGLLPALIRRHQEQQARFGTAGTPRPAPVSASNAEAGPELDEEEDDLPF